MALLIMCGLIVIRLLSQRRDGALAAGRRSLVSVATLILEEAEQRRFPRPSDLVVLTAVAVLENFGYRQFGCVMFRILRVFRRKWA